MSAAANQFKTFVLLLALTVVLLLVGQLVGGMQGLTIAFIIVLLMNGLSYFFSHKLVLFMYRAKEAKESQHPDLFKTVREVAKLANIPMPKVYIIPSDSPNAFATGRNPKNAVVACTEGIMKLLNHDELKGVIAHEVAHIKNRDILIQTIAATIAGVISYVAMMARWAAIFGGFGGDRDGDSGGILGWLALAILAPIIALIIQLAISRSREYLADETGAKTIHNPLALASALEKLEKGISHNPLRFGNATTSSLFIANPFSAKGLFTLFSTHPPMNERIKRLRKMRA
ncbi:zinc metalloprotease HtpX [Candidatus Woesearchaeota archaeon]|nr:zinc metalloprotease HtpX [Candidatus Woesearchaeota archaeon]